MYIHTAKHLNFCQARWSFSHVFHPGSKHGKPVALSRIWVLNPVTSSRPLFCQGSIETSVCSAQPDKAAPSQCPVNRPFVPSVFVPRSSSGGHSSGLSCHPGVRHILAFICRFWWTLSPPAQSVLKVRSPHNLSLNPCLYLKRPQSHTALDFVTCLPTRDGNATILSSIISPNLCMASEKPSSWCLQLPWIEYSINYLPFALSLSPFVGSLGYQSLCYLPGRWRLLPSQVFVCHCHQNWRRALSQIVIAVLSVITEYFFSVNVTEYLKFKENVEAFPRSRFPRTLAS